MPWIFVRQRARQILTRMQAVYAKIDARAAKQKPVGVEVFLADPTRFQAQISQLSASWRPLTEEPRMAELLASYIYTAPDRYVLKLRPFELAELYGLDPMATLRFFLKATRAGFLNLSWDLLCPGCQGAKAAASSLSTLNPHAHCDICDIDYTVSLDENFELTFHPVATVRSVFDTPFCAGSPSNTGHLAQQFNVWPREHKQLTLSLPSGSYRFRCPSMQGYVAFEVALGGQRQYQLLLGEAFDNTAKLILAPACEVQIVNQRNLFQTLRIEDLAWRSLRVSAALVSSLQDFRDSFSSEVLRPGVQLAVSNLTVMFTDLKDSTSMYELRGDATAFSLVQEHFDIMRELISGYQGAIVKTIGDAVMAVFQDPLRALRCALEIQQVFGERKQRQPEHPIVVKLGLHLGPSIALNLNERLDYFGTTVNKAARIQSESLGEDIVLSPAMLESEGVLELIAGMPLSAFEKNLKGLSGLTRLYRLEPLKPQPALSDGETPMIAKPSA
ncbi:MAG: hypothetical protein CVV27_18380 [Candidatus Melainabacteria bacterium HGW-Melainabacteria-1]|nr:MAG: hypothetical protein CVV27_18380 [Candidatus Melainabacteria bacterium HGW-Melainabacteria-1]